MSDALAMRMRDFWYANVTISVHVHMQTAQLKGEQTQARDGSDWLHHSTHFLSIHGLGTESACCRIRTQGARFGPYCCCRSLAGFR